jgi:hypothetical protein
MTNYRVLFFDGQGRVRRTHTLECETDHEAAAHVARFRHAHAIELWLGSRLVLRIDGDCGA